jgi:hypothetical protein
LDLVHVARSVVPSRPIDSATAFSSGPLIESRSSRTV